MSAAADCFIAAFLLGAIAFTVYDTEFCGDDSGFVAAVAASFSLCLGALSVLMWVISIAQSQ